SFKAGGGFASVSAFGRDGHRLSGFPLSFKAFERTLLAVGNIDADAEVEIVVVARGNDEDLTPPRVLVVSPKGRIKRSMLAVGTVSAYSATAPALADLDGDGIPEIVVQTDTAINVWKGDGRILPGWPVLLGPDTTLGNASPVVADVDGDGHPDIVVVVPHGPG